MSASQSPMKQTGIFACKMSVKISKLTGLIDEYTVDGKARLKSGRGLLKCFPIMKIRGE